ncbi:hypothetical protein EST38_g10331 [Candolleomyces aberdarensis]|uniref:Ubiquitin-like domain-containing protein n=1 Tax=Candolleomyces aberdarensis TaxID=2316362 RepID=A0A4Q2D8D2_9AGAR|nr:hypothetical protein EST38_g10331 [Candolleomyces aberdarensis]
MADFQAELAFAKTYLNTLGRQPVIFADDYHQSPENSLKRVPILPIPLPPVPEPRSVEGGATDLAAISLTFKSLKPALTYAHPVSLTDTILSIKEQLHTLHPEEIPTPENQRLLLKGKALADQKLLKEYTVKEGDTINLMFKAPPQGTPQVVAPKPVHAAPSDSSMLSSPTPPNPFASSAGSLDPDAKAPSGGRKHQRIPSVVLSPSPSNETQAHGEKPKEILLDLDTEAAVPLSPVLRDELTLTSSYHDTISKPEFWQRLLEFLESQFQTESDAHLAFEDFLRASKGSLTVNDIAKIRDKTGVVGMAGT